MMDYVPMKRPLNNAMELFQQLLRSLCLEVPNYKGFGFEEGLSKVLRAYTTPMTTSIALAHTIVIESNPGHEKRCWLCDDITEGT